MRDSYQLDRLDGVSSLKDMAHRAIKEAILTLRLEPGTLLVESELAQQLGISKTPVRDALQELEREGFVTRILFKGTYVTDVTMKDVTEVFQLRAVLEGLAARLAAPVFTQQELDAIASRLDAAERAWAAGDVPACSLHGQALHEAIIGKADNQRLLLINRNLDEHVRRFRALSDRIAGRLGKSIAEHRRVLAALYDRDGERAEQAMRQHLESVLQDLTHSGGQAPAG